MNTFEELTEIIEEVYLVFKDAFKRDDIEVGRKASALMERLGSKRLALHLENIYQICDERTERE